jgi:hypothetical protein
LRDGDTPFVDGRPNVCGLPCCARVRRRFVIMGGAVMADDTTGPLIAAPGPDPKLA